MDLYPTLNELCGVPVRDDIDGSSLVPLLRDPEALRSQPALTTHGRGNHAIRSERWRYIRYADGSEELYDHREDPMEWTNLAGDEAYAEVIAEARKWLPTTEAPNAPKR